MIQEIKINENEEREIEFEDGVNFHVERAYYSAKTKKFKLTGWIYIKGTPQAKRYCEIEGRIDWNSTKLPTFADIAQRNKWKGMTVVNTIKPGFKKFIEDFYTDIKKAEKDNEVIEIRTWEEYPQFKEIMGGIPDRTFEYSGCKIARMERPYGVTYFISSTIFKK